MNELFRLMAQCLDIDESELTLDTSSDDLDAWDSLAIINLAMALEGEYGISLSAEEVEKLKSVRLVVELLGRHGVALAG